MLISFYTLCDIIFSHLSFLYSVQQGMNMENVTVHTLCILSNNLMKRSYHINGSLHALCEHEYVMANNLFIKPIIHAFKWEFKVYYLIKIVYINYI